MSITYTNTRARRARTVIAGFALTAALAAPTAAHATLPATVSNANWDVRHSWVNYITNPIWGIQGTVTRTASNGGTSTSITTYGGTTWSAPSTNTQYGTRFAKSTDSGSPRTLVFKGGLDFDLPAHSIDISIKDVKVVYVTSTTEKVLVDATYVPLGGTTQTLSDAHAFNVSSTGAVTLTATGAQIFNGGSNGSYAAGDPFGGLYYS